MPRITSIEPGFYRIPLPHVLTDSMHGEMRAFELNTVRIRDVDGAEGTGYTFTVGRNGAAIDAVLVRELPEIMDGEDADAIERWAQAHSAIKKQIDHLKVQEGAALAEAFETLRTLVNDHVEDEERNLLPALDDAATPQQLDGLGARVLQAKQRGG